MMRAFDRQTWFAFAALVATAAAMLPPRASGQGGGFGGPGGLNSLPSTIFGDKKEERNVSGPSLSATDEPVAEIRIEGNRTIRTEQVLSQLQTRVGRPFDPALVQKDVLTLNQRGWFVDVQPSYERTPAGRIVIYRVFERPVIRYVQYLGNSEIREKKLAKETDLRIGGPVDPYVVEDARKKIVELYQNNGFNRVQVTILEGSKPTDQGVVFVINEGPKQRIRRVIFEGADFVSGQRLKKKISSKPPLMYVFKGYLNEAQLEDDVEQLKAFYRAFGFFQARVGKVIEYNKDEDWATVRFVVVEGPRYQVQDVAFLGNKVFANDSLAMLVKLPAGQPYEQAVMNADLQRLKDVYGSRGYVFADIRAETIFLEETGQLRIAYHVDEGKQWRVGRVFVHIDGDTPHTRIQTVINRLSFQPGQIVDTRELRASEIRLQRSQLFLADPSRGAMPKITYNIQDLESELARGGSSEFRGQSPDGFGLGVGSREPRAISLLPVAPAPAASAGPPLIAPPGAWSGRPAQTIAVPPPAGFVDQDDQIDVHLYLHPPTNQPAPPAAADRSAATGQPLSPTALRYEARRPPYEDTAAPAPAPRPSVYQQIAPQGNAYQQIAPRPAAPETVVRGQDSGSPPASGWSRGYFETGYGGQTVGATGPEAAPIGGNRYAAQQAAAPATLPAGQQIVPTQYTVPANGAAPAPAGAPVFPPPMLPPPQYGTPQPVGPPLGPPQSYPPAATYPPSNTYPTPQYAPGPQYGAPITLPPDPTITPVRPIPTNPQLTPYTPTDPFTPTYDQGYVDITAAVSEGQTGRLMLGVAVNSDAGLVGQILLDEQNFDWTRVPTSWDDFASGRAFRGAGQRFRLEAAPGTEVQRYLVSFQEPYLLDFPISLGLSGSFFNRRYIDWDEERIGGRVSLGYQWVENDVSAALSYRGESIKIDNLSTPGLPELDEVKGTNALHGFKLTVANDTRDSVFLATQGHYLEFSAEQVIGTFEYPRLTADARKYFLLHERPDHSGRHVFTAATQLGFTGSNTPVYENFFAGGFTTLRGWDFRGVGPVSGLGNVRVGGEFMWVNTLEYLFPLTADDMMHGVVFTDFGTVEEKVEIEDFRASAGFGLRITVPAMGPAPIALDFAWPISKADADDTQVFSFFMGFTR